MGTLRTRALSLTPPASRADLSHFKDADQVAFWAEPYVKPLVEQKVISGSNGSLLPTSYLTKAQIASIIFNLN